MTKIFKKDSYDYLVELEGEGEISVSNPPIDLIIIDPKTLPRWKIFLIELLLK